MAKSSLVPNFRHVLVKVHGMQRQLSPEEFKAEMSKLLILHFGVEGASRVGGMVEKFDPKENEAVLRCTRGTEMELVAALALEGEFAGVQARLETLGISGTIRALAENQEK